MTLVLINLLSRSKTVKSLDPDRLTWVRIPAPPLACSHSVLGKLLDFSQAGFPVLLNRNSTHFIGFSAQHLGAHGHTIITTYYFNQLLPAG